MSSNKMKIVGLLIGLGLCGMSPVNAADADVARRLDFNSPGRPLFAEETPHKASWNKNKNTGIQLGWEDIKRAGRLTCHYVSSGFAGVGAALAAYLVWRNVQNPHSTVVPLGETALAAGAGLATGLVAGRWTSDKVYKLEQAVADKNDLQAAQRDLESLRPTLRAALADRDQAQQEKISSEELLEQARENAELAKKMQEDLKKLAAQHEQDAASSRKEALSVKQELDEIKQAGNTFIAGQRSGLLVGLIGLRLHVANTQMTMGLSKQASLPVTAEQESALNSAQQLLNATTKIGMQEVLAVDSTSLEPVFRATK